MSYESIRLRSLYQVDLHVDVAMVEDLVQYSKCHEHTQLLYDH